MRRSSWSDCLIDESAAQHPQPTFWHPHPETLQQAKTQRWAPEELLRTLVEAEIAARDAANLRQRRTAAGFPVAKTLEEFKVQPSSVPQATFDYLAALEWVRAAENLCLVGPAGTGKSHCETAAGDHGACRRASLDGGS